MTQRYLIKCKKCKKENVIDIDQNNRVQYPENTTLLSSRFRADMAWGFECLCGNDTRLCDIELQDKNKQVQIKGSSKQTVGAIIDNLRLIPDDNFIMQEL